MMIKNISKYVFVVCLAVSCLVKADFNYSIDAKARSLPTVGNLQFTANYDQLLWGEKKEDNPLYGYLRAGVKAGGSPTVAGFLQIAPIAPVIFEVQKGITQRFLKISGLACSDVECKGKIDRTDYSIKLLGAFKELIFVGNVIWREIRTESSTQLIGLEYEFFEVSPGMHHFLETSWVLGYKLDPNQVVGLMGTNGEISEGNRRFSSLYGIYRFPYQDLNLAVGLGNYKSDQNDLNQLSTIFTATYQWGPRLSLF